MGDVGDQLRLHAFTFQPFLYGDGHSGGNTVEIFPVFFQIAVHPLCVGMIGQITGSQRLARFLQLLQRHGSKQNQRQQHQMQDKPYGQIHTCQQQNKLNQCYCGINDRHTPGKGKCLYQTMQILPQFFYPPDHEAYPPPAQTAYHSDQAVFYQRTLLDAGRQAHAEAKTHTAAEQTAYGIQDHKGHYVAGTDIQCYRQWHQSNRNIRYQQYV